MINFLNKKLKNILMMLRNRFSILSLGFIFIVLMVIPLLLNCFNIYRIDDKFSFIEYYGVLCNFILAFVLYFFFQKKYNEKVFLKNKLFDNFHAIIILLDQVSYNIPENIIDENYKLRIIKDIKQISQSFQKSIKIVSIYKFTIDPQLSKTFREYHQQLKYQLTGDELYSGCYSTNTLSSVPLILTDMEIILHQISSKLIYL